MKRLETVTNIVLIIAAVAVAGGDLWSVFLACACRWGRECSGGAEAQVENRCLSRPHYPSAVRAQLLCSCRKIVIFVSRVWTFTGSWQLFVSEDNTCDVKLVAVGPKAREKRGDIVSYLADQKLKVDGVDVADYASLGISGTPTLVLRRFVAPG